MIVEFICLDSISAVIKAGETSFSLALKTADAPAFGDFISTRLDELFAAFQSDKSKRAGD